MSDKDPQNKPQTFLAPCLLRGDNVTPLSRTPWAGTRIASEYKSALVVPRRIGESWEVSVEPDFPSMTEEGLRLDELIAANLEGWLGKHAKTHGGLGLLVKLLDASMALSVQIHPRDDDPALADDESGKPECWYILDADEGAGIYLGLAPNVDLERMRTALENDDDVSELLNFVPCQPGDFFVLPPGTPHAVGAGLTLVEPQRVLPGRRGLTYRYWDHGRRYDGDGNLDPKGDPRTLHVERALAVTDWEALRGEAVVESLRRRLGPANLSGDAEEQSLCGPNAPLSFDYVSAKRLVGTGRLELSQTNTCQSLTVLAGVVEIGGVVISAGRSALLPAMNGEMWSPSLCEAHALMAHLP
ncbi:MAG: mannose-6-phosphate isomerase class I [Polyangiales bacterium]|jgi:mannose-6-phosphate isomerase class I